ncbi:MAG TPA: DNA-3-methyladenine glycosylase [candidate division Zixibacteria bacterium]
MKRRLRRCFYNRATLKVARELLGKYLVLKRDGKFLSGKIVETEAYIGRGDKASHASRGKTKRNEVMFGAPGYAYIYFTYGMYHCLNFVTEKENFPAAVLIRALQPKDGVEIMKKNRKTDTLENLTNGPGKVCMALGLDRRMNGIDLCSDILYVEDRNERKGKFISTSRVGINVGKDKKWRFHIKDNKFVSR